MSKKKYVKLLVKQLSNTETPIDCLEEELPKIIKRFGVGNVRVYDKKKEAYMEYQGPQPKKEVNNAEKKND